MNKHFRRAWRELRTAFQRQDIDLIALFVFVFTLGQVVFGGFDMGKLALAVWIFAFIGEKALRKSGERELARVELDLEHAKRAAAIHEEYAHKLEAIIRGESPLREKPRKKFVS